MTDGQQCNNSQFPGEALSIAEAISLRYAQEQDTIAQLFAELQGVPYEAASLEEQANAMMGRTVLLLARVNDPSMPLGMDEYMAVNYGTKGIDELAAALQADGIELDPDSIRAAHGDWINEFSDDAGYDGVTIADDFNKELDSVRKLAEQQGISVLDVLEDDELYIKSQANAYELEELKSKAKRIIKALSGDFMVKMCTQLIDTVLAPDMIEGMDPLEVQEMKAGILEELRLNPELKYQGETFKEAAKQYMLHLAATLHGTDRATSEYLTDPEIKPTWPLSKFVVNSLIDNSGPGSTFKGW